MLKPIKTIEPAKIIRFIITVRLTFYYREVFSLTNVANIYSDVNDQIFLRKVIKKAAGR